jgi:predicted flap endonuclease-1-like 5' DNA nuclease
VAQRFAQRLGKPVKYVTMGKKGRDSLIRARANVVAEFSGLPADPTIATVSPVAKLAIDEFLSGQVDAVFIAYTDFINTLTQRPTVLSWLPMQPYMTDDHVLADMLKGVPEVSSGSLIYEYEPSAEAILNEIAPRFTELQLYHALLESQASEHSARMVAMRNASDNATQLTGDLTLVYNKVRQSAITAEILDIVGGANALQASIDALAASIETGKATNGATSKIVYQSIQTEPPPKPKASKSKAAKGDDLTKLEGIGPKMSAALVAGGLDSYEKLSQATEETIRQAVEAAGLRFAPSIPTWAKQAALAAKGDWDGLNQYQEKLDGGRES